MKKCPFKIGDRVKHKETGRIGIVTGIPGTPTYDACGYLSAEKGFRLVYEDRLSKSQFEDWEWWHNYEVINFT